MKKIRLILSAVMLVCTLATLTSCGGNDNKGMTDGTVTVGMNDSGKVSDVIVGTDNKTNNSMK